MKSRVGKNETDLTVGPIFKKLILFSLPLMATNVLQLLFNATDIAVLGIAGYNVGPVGSTGALINLIIGLFVGLSVGANVMVAKYVGSNQKERAERVVGMSVLLALIVGAALSVVGFFCARIFLEWMSCPIEFLDDATTYMQIYFLGMPIILLYNYCASILRAVGDTVRPLIYLVIAGVVNLGLNFLLTYVFRMGVAGVAVATVVSQLISAVLAMITLLRSKGFAHFSFKNMRFFKSEIGEMLRIGLPAGLQGCVFSLSNVVIQSTVNSFGTVAVDGNTIAAQIDGFIYNAMYSVGLACMSFVGQNLGAKNITRIKRTVRLSLATVLVVGVTASGIALLLARPIGRVMSHNDSQVVNYMWNRLLITSTLYFTCGLMDVMSSTMRGLGKSTIAMVISLSCSCLFRIVWINTVCRYVNTPQALYWVFPVSWVLTFTIYVITYFPTLKRVERRLQADAAECAESADIVERNEPFERKPCGGVAKGDKLGTQTDKIE